MNQLSEKTEVTSLSSLQLLSDLFFTTTTVNSNKPDHVTTLDIHSIIYTVVSNSFIQIRVAVDLEPTP